LLRENQPPEPLRYVEEKDDTQSGNSYQNGPSDPRCETLKIPRTDYFFGEKNFIHIGLNLEGKRKRRRLSTLVPFDCNKERM
jgi:hypothetical protein